MRRLKQSGQKQLFKENVVSSSVPVQINGYINMPPIHIYGLVLSTENFQCFTYTVTVTVFKFGCGQNPSYCQAARI
jgi:hypothetical protein